MKCVKCDKNSGNTFVDNKWLCTPCTDFYSWTVEGNYFRKVQTNSVFEPHNENTQRSPGYFSRA